MAVINFPNKPIRINKPSVVKRRFNKIRASRAAPAAPDKSLTRFARFARAIAARANEEGVNDPRIYLQKLVREAKDSIQGGDSKGKGTLVRGALPQSAGTLSTDPQVKHEFTTKQTRNPKTLSYKLTDRVSLHPPDSAWYAFMANPTAYLKSPEPPAPAGLLIHAISLKKTARYSKTMLTDRSVRLSCGPHWSPNLHMAYVTTSSNIDISGTSATQDDPTYGTTGELLKAEFTSGTPDAFLAQGQGLGFHCFCGGEIRVTVEVFGEDSQATVAVYDPAMHTNSSGVGVRYTSTNDVLEGLDIEAREPASNPDFGQLAVIGNTGTKIEPEKVMNTTRHFVLRVAPKFQWRTHPTSSATHDCLGLNNLHADFLEGYPFIDISNTGSRNISVSAQFTAFYWSIPNSNTGFASCIATPMPHYAIPPLVGYACLSASGPTIHQAQVHAGVKIMQHPGASFSKAPHHAALIGASISKAPNQQQFETSGKCIVQTADHTEIDGETKLSLKSVGTEFLRDVGKAVSRNVEKGLSAAVERISPAASFEGILDHLRSLWH